jgi:hypothetical protein
LVGVLKVTEEQQDPDSYQIDLLLEIARNTFSFNEETAKTEGNQSTGQ